MNIVKKLKIPIKLVRMNPTNKCGKIASLKNHFQVLKVKLAMISCQIVARRVVSQVNQNVLQVLTTKLRQKNHPKNMKKIKVKNHSEMLVRIFRKTFWKCSVTYLPGTIHKLTSSFHPMKSKKRRISRKTRTASWRKLKKR